MKAERKILQKLLDLLTEIGFLNDQQSTEERVQAIYRAFKKIPDPKVQGMIVKQNALGHATELLKHNAMMDNKQFLSKDVMALAQIYADWVMSEEANPEKVKEVVQTATDALMNEKP